MNLMIFIKKEIMEIYKTSKIIVMPVVFIFFAIISPLSARFTNELLSLMGQQQGVTIKVPDPVYTDSYLQLFKNFSFVALIVLILVFSGSVVDEKTKGTAALVLTKNLSRTGFIVGKLITAVLFFTVVYCLSAGLCVFYTSLLFQQFYNDRLFAGLLLYWVYMVMIICISLLSSVAARSYTTSAVISFMACIAISLLGSVPSISKYTPGALQGLPVSIICGTGSISEAYIPLAGAAAIIIACIGVSIKRFRTQEL